MSPIRRPYVFVIVLFLCQLVACTVNENRKPVEYKGPVREAEGIVIYYNENDRPVMKVEADQVLEFANGDKEFPKGLYIRFYNEQGILSSVLSTRHAYFFDQKNQWRGRGKVIIRNEEKKEQLNTEELFWDPNTRKIHTDKFVTIKIDQEIIYGTGLIANQDLSSYQILKPAGMFNVE